MTSPLDAKTRRGCRVVWRHGPLVADDPLSAWQGLLSARGLTESAPFFTPRLTDLPDPDGMRDMDRAAGRLVAAITGEEPIHIFGDFDADGANGTAILVEALRGAGAHVSFSIPHRVDDGHGIGVVPVLEAHAAGVQLGISVDTGTHCFEACSQARKLGFDLIVTDHHLPETTLPPAFALLNPAREDCGFAERKLCGAGVAFFLLMCVWKRLRDQGRPPAFDLRGLLDRVAVATVADVMDLTGVNRILVHHGLQRLNTSPSVGMAALMRVAKVRKPVSAETIGYYLAPRINAAGRMRHGEEAMRLLSTDDTDEAVQLARVLDETNGIGGRLRPRCSDRPRPGWSVRMCWRYTTRHGMPALSDWPPDVWRGSMGNRQLWDLSHRTAGFVSLCADARAFISATF